MPGLPAPGGQGNNPFGGQPGSNPFAGLPGFGGLPGGNMTGLPFGGAGGLPPFMPGFPGGFPQLPPNGGGWSNSFYHLMLDCSYSSFSYRKMC